MPPPQTRAGEHGPAHGPGEPHEHPVGGPAGHAHDEPHHEHGFLGTVQAIGTAQRHRRRRRLVLGLLFGIAAVGALGELLARAQPAASPTAATAPGPPGFLVPDQDPLLRYAPPADTRLQLDGHLHAFGPFGVRGLEAHAPRDPEERRLLLVGAADVLGLGRPEDAAPAARLAARLEAARAGHGGAWRGLALGAPGYTARQALRAFERAAETLAPDLVVLDLAESMFSEPRPFLDRHGQAQRDFLPLPDGLRRFLWRHSALYGAIAGRHAAEVLDVPEPAFDARPPNAFERPENQADGLAAVAALAERCRARQLPLLVVFQSALPCQGTDPAAERVRQRVAALQQRLAELELPHAGACLEDDRVELVFAALERQGLVP